MKEALDSNTLSQAQPNAGKANIMEIGDPRGMEKN